MAVPSSCPAKAIHESGKGGNGRASPPRSVARNAATRSGSSALIETWRSAISSGPFDEIPSCPSRCGATAEGSFQSEPCSGTEPQERQVTHHPDRKQQPPGPDDDL